MSDRYHKRFNETLNIKRALEAELVRSLGAVVRGLTEGVVDFNDQRGALLDARGAIDKALRLNDAGLGKLSAGVGHLADNMDGMEGDDTLDRMFDTATMIVSEHADQRDNPAAIAAVLRAANPGALAGANEFMTPEEQQRALAALMSGCEPAMFLAAFASLPIERQAALAFEGDAE